MRDMRSFFFKGSLFLSFIFLTSFFSHFALAGDLSSVDADMKGEQTKSVQQKRPVFFHVLNKDQETVNVYEVPGAPAELTSKAVDKYNDSQKVAFIDESIKKYATKSNFRGTYKLPKPECSNKENVKTVPACGWGGWGWGGGWGGGWGRVGWGWGGGGWGGGWGRVGWGWGWGRGGWWW